MQTILLRLLLLVLILSAPNNAAGAAASATKEEGKNGSSGFELSKKDPIYITADWMEVDQTKNTIVYKGRVVTVQTDMTMRSETLTAYIDPETKKMKQIIAEGKVNATQGNRVATGEKAVFDDTAKTVTLTGSPVMRPCPAARPTSLSRARATNGASSATARSRSTAGSCSCCLSRR